jgi:MscS family membrane protein
LIGALFAWLVRFLCRKIGSDPQWRLFLTVAAVAVFAWLMVPFCAQLHISGSVLFATGTASVAVLYLAATWAVFIGAGAIAESIVRIQQSRVGGIDSQLIRLGARLIGLVTAIALLIEGADEMGFPSYSVLTGLGFGGFAIAFAARETLANLLGSIAIMLEKPFRSGDWIKVDEAEGKVEYVGFRSTRIRTFGDSLISIPNSVVANAVIDNLDLRGRRRQRFFVQITYGTPPEKVEIFVDGIRRIIAEHPLTDKNVSYIYFNSFGESGLDILLYFYLQVPDFATELREREAILMKILKLGKAVGVEFAFPTRTLHIDGAPDWSERKRYPEPATSEN